MLEVVAFIGSVLFILFILLEVSAFFVGFSCRTGTGYPDYELSQAADDVWGLFWHMWLAGFTLGDKYRTRFDGEFKKARKQKRLDFAAERLGKVK